MWKGDRAVFLTQVFCWPTTRASATNPSWECKGAPMPYTHFHAGRFHTHRTRLKDGRHYQTVRRRQKPWRVGFMLALVAALMGCAVLVAQAWFAPQWETAMKSTAGILDDLSKPTVEVAPTEAPADTRPSVPEPTASSVRMTVEAVLPDLRHVEEKRYMLALINDRRQEADVDAVVLGDNIAAQVHAESSLEGCFSSHWGADGLKPYMRYTLAGGAQSNGENGFGSDYCVRPFQGYSAIGNIREEIDKAMDQWMTSPGHAKNILDPTHMKVNVGIAWDQYNVVMYQHFEGGHVDYDRLPSISDGVLSLSGKVKNGGRVRTKRDLGVQIYYDAPPVSLTRGQLSRTYCYDSGRIVAGLRETLSGGSRWTTDSFTTKYDPCPDPYKVPADAEPPGSLSEANAIWRQVKIASQAFEPLPLIVPWVTAREYRVDDDGFAVRANIQEILARHGDGVYTVMVWGDMNGRRTAISQFSMFHGIVPPDTYHLEP